MVFTKTLPLILATFFIPRIECNVVDYLEVEESEIICANISDGSEEKDKCLEEACLENSSTFECQALRCKLRFPISELGNNLKQNMDRLRCVKRVCKNNASHNFCQNLKACDSTRKGPLGKTKFIVCAANLFAKK